MHAQYEVLHVAQWPAVHDLHQLASRHYAFEGQCFVIAAGCVLSRGDIIEGFNSLAQPNSEAVELLEAIPGGGHNLIMKGESAVIALSSQYLKGPVFDEAYIIYAEIRTELVATGHLLLDTDRHYSRPDILRLEVNDQPQANVTFESRGKQRV